MVKAKSVSSAVEEAMRGINGASDFINQASTTGSLMDKALRDTRSLADLASGHTSELSNIDKALRAVSGITDTASKYSTGSFIDKTMENVLKAQRGPFESVMSRSDPFADAVRGIKGFGDDSTFAGVKTGLDKYETAATALRDELAKGQLRDPLKFAETEPRFPSLPPMPRNPVLKTNELLDEMVEGLSGQRALIEASAEAQKRETELLGQLVEAFTISQADSDRANRKARMQAWIGIGVAIATGAIPILIQLITGH